MRATLAARAREATTMSNGNTKERVGIVGVGRVGLAMLKHLLRHGHAVTACDIDEAQLAKARDAGAATVKTPAEVARAALASEASGQRGHSKVRAHSASEDARERADDTRPEPGSSQRAAGFVIVGVGYD